MADERVQPSLAFQQLAKRRAHPASDSASTSRDHLYAFKYHGKPASVDPHKPATVFQAPPPDSATIWAAHPTRRGSTKGAEHRFTATETPAKEYEVALIWDPVAQTWLLEPLDSHFTFKLDRSSKPPPPKTPAVPTEDELHAHAKSFFSSSAPNPFSSFPFSYSVTAQSLSASGNRPENGQEEATRPQTPPRPVSAGSLASLLNPLSASSPSHHPATFSPVNAAASGSAEKKKKPSSPSPKSARIPPPVASSPNSGRLAPPPPERVALRADVKDFGEIRSSSASLGASQKLASPSTLRGIAAGGNSPSSSSSTRQQPPHPSYGSKVSASYAARQAAAAAAAEAEQQKRLERELKAMDSSPSSSSSSEEDDSDGQDEWQPVTIAPEGGNRRQQEEEEEEDDDDFGGGGRKQRPKKRSRGTQGTAAVNTPAGGAAGPSARARQTRSGRVEVVHPHPHPQVQADRAIRPDLLRAATTTATSAIQRVAPKIDSDSDSAESEDDDDDASSAEDGDGSGSASSSRKMTTARRAGARSSSRPDRSSATGAVRSPARVTSLLSQQVNAQMARIRSSSAAANGIPSAKADHYPRIMTAAAVQQQQQARAAASVSATTGATVNQQQPAQGPPPPSRHHKPRPSLPPPRNSDEARQLAEREADIPDSSEED